MTSLIFNQHIDVSLNIKINKMEVLTSDEQRISIKFLGREWIEPTNIYLPDICLNKMQVYVLHKMFMEGLKAVKNEAYARIRKAVWSIKMLVSLAASYYYHHTTTTIYTTTFTKIGKTWISEEKKISNFRYGSVNSGKTGRNALNNFRISPRMAIGQLSHI